MKLGLALLVFAAACGDSTKPASPDAPNATPDAAMRDILGAVTDLANAPIAGAKVCVIDHPAFACATTDATGAFTLAIPAALAGEVAVEFSATGYLAIVKLGNADAFPSGLQLAPDATGTKLLHTDAGFTYPDPAHGFLGIHLVGPTSADRIVGATVALSPAGTAVYANASGTSDPSLTATTTTGALVFGNVPPGRVTATVTAPGKTCSALGSPGVAIVGDWLPTGAGTSDAFVAANALTDHLFIVCR